jgi:hypothetical protein
MFWNIVSTLAVAFAILVFIKRNRVPKKLPTLKVVHPFEAFLTVVFNPKQKFLGGIGTQPIFVASSWRIKYGMFVMGSNNGKTPYCAITIFWWDFIVLLLLYPPFKGLQKTLYKRVGSKRCRVFETTAQLEHYLGIK